MGNESSSVGYWVGLGAAVIGLIASLVLLAGQVTEDELACTMDALIVGEDGEWTGVRDPSRDCAWVLYDADGNPAPREIYEQYGVEEPPSRWGLSTWVLVVGVVAISVTIVSMIVRRPGSRRGDPPSSTLDDDATSPPSDTP